ncbi:hypothetical protein BDN71DRAFT_1513879 [Pleurotus eryngii]|uniref:Uncharacterized protein n=1 Tax=Pleurotus eryngii TaxID=5323 RepID=A0A9P6D9B2_PLEER|nr:hypothetical protein BDN71DRAFT_1513879 [Pleurotus eryngii]
MSTKLMTPWVRRETIDNHARGWNWQKITQFGSTLMQGLHEALAMKPLQQGDVQCPQHQDEVPGPGESHREISWIWLSVSSGLEGVEHALEDIQPMGPADITDCLKTEWVKSRVCAARWTEEQDLVLEEMRRVLAYLKWQENWWKEQATRCSVNITPEVLDGLTAYAIKQGNILCHLHQCFAGMWRPQLLSYGLDAEWILEVDLAVADVPDNSTLSNESNEEPMSVVD